MMPSGPDDAARSRDVAFSLMVPGLARYLWRHPQWIPSVIRAAWRLRQTDWWRRRPWLPVPDLAYWAFRVHTAAGSDGRALSPQEVVAVARWSNHQRASR